MTNPKAHPPLGYDVPLLFVDSEPRRGGSESTQSVINPATGDSLGVLGHADEADMDRALQGADRSFASWSRMTPQKRGRILQEAARLLRERAEVIAGWVTAEVGKPRAQSMWEIEIAAQTLDWFAEEGRRAYGRIIPGDFDGIRFSVMRQPVGVVVALATWNFPVVNAARKIGAALAAGCSCIYKPDEEAPASGFAVPQALIDSALPSGVLSVLFGDPARVSSHLLASPLVRKLSFTGSIPVGRHLMKLAADRNIRTTMELGGHAPAIVMDDANVESVVSQAMASKFRNAGQVCISPTRFLVQEHIFEAFTAQFAAATKAMRVGDCGTGDMDMGPMIHERRRSAVADIVDDAREAGAKLLAGGEKLPGAGFFYAPTVLVNVPASARIMHEEPFGPVAVINRFTTLEDALGEANRLPFGLAAYVFSSSLASVRRLREGIEAGMLAINSFVISHVEAPFMGVKHSGHGAENGIEGLDDYLITKSVSENWP